MVQEYRRIILNKQELFSAIECHRRTAPHFLPEGEIIDFEVLSPTSMMITVETEPAHHEASVIFPDDKLLQALIRFCIENNIMLPRQGNKSVTVASDNTSLCIDMDFSIHINESAPLLQALAG